MATCNTQKCDQKLPLTSRGFQISSINWRCTGGTPATFPLHSPQSKHVNKTNNRTYRCAAYGGHVSTFLCVDIGTPLAIHPRVAGHSGLSGAKNEMRAQPMPAAQTRRVVNGLPFVEALARRMASTMPHSIDVGDLVD